jgi:hypothetical protein
MRRRNRLMLKLKSSGGYSGGLGILNFSCLDCAKFTHDMKKTQIFRLIRGAHLHYLEKSEDIPG